MTRALEQRIRSGLVRVQVGEVTAAASGGRVRVNLVGSSILLPVLRSYTPAVGDECLVIMRSGRGGFVVGALGTAPPAPAPADPTPRVDPPPEDPTTDRPVYGSDVFRPNSTGSYRNGSWRGDTPNLYQGDWSGRGVNTGAAFFGRSVKGLRGVTVTRIRVRLKRLEGGAYAATAPTLHLFSENGRTSGGPTTVTSTAGPALRIGESRDFTLPDTWGSQLVAGTAGGVGIRVPGSSPYVQIRGASLALLIDWRK